MALMGGGGGGEVKKKATRQHHNTDALRSTNTKTTDEILLLVLFRDNRWRFLFVIQTQRVALHLAVSGHFWVQVFFVFVTMITFTFPLP